MKKRKTQANLSWPLMCSAGNTLRRPIDPFWNDGFEKYDKVLRLKSPGQMLGPQASTWTPNPGLLTGSEDVTWGGWLGIGGETLFFIFWV